MTNDRTKIPSPRDLPFSRFAPPESEYLNEHGNSDIYQGVIAYLKNKKIGSITKIWIFEYQNGARLCAIYISNGKFASKIVRRSKLLHY